MHNFNIYTSDLVSNLGIEYDYVSCLHYGPYAFTINGLPTIIALQVRIYLNSIFLVILFKHRYSEQAMILVIN